MSTLYTPECSNTTNNAPWATRLPADYTRSCGVAELHSVIFVPAEDAEGWRDTMSIGLPECASFFRGMMRRANKERFRVCLLCDTREQAVSFAARAAKLLPRHRRVPLGRASRGDYGDNDEAWFERFPLGAPVDRFEFEHAFKKGRLWCAGLGEPDMRRVVDFFKREWPGVRRILVYSGGSPLANYVCRGPGADNRWEAIEPGHNDYHY